MREEKGREKSWGVRGEREREELEGEGGEREKSWGVRGGGREKSWGVRGRKGEKSYQIDSMCLRTLVVPLQYIFRVSTIYRGSTVILLSLPTQTLILSYFADSFPCVRIPRQHTTIEQ